MNRTKKVIAIVIMAVIMTIAAATRITWADVTETEEVSAESVQEISGTVEQEAEGQESVAGQEATKDESGGLGSPSDAVHDFENTQADSEKENHTFEISDKEVDDMEDVIFDVVDDTKPDLSTEEAPAGNVVIAVTEEDVVLIPDKEEEKVSITVEPIQTEPAKPEESQVIVESQEAEVIRPEVPETVKTEAGTPTLSKDMAVIPEKEVTAVEIGKVEEPAGTHKEVTVIPAASAAVIQEVPNVITESPADTKEPPKKPEQPEPEQRPSRHPSGGNHHKLSVIQPVQGPKVSENPSTETVTAVVPNIILVPEKTSIPTADGLPKTGDTISLYGILCLLSGIGILIVLVSGHKEASEAPFSEVPLQMNPISSICKSMGTVSDRKAAYKKKRSDGLGNDNRYPTPIRKIYKRIGQGKHDVDGRMPETALLLRSL